MSAAVFWEAYGINVNVKNKELTYVVEVLEYRNSVQYVKEMMNALRRLVVIIGSNNEICTVLIHGDCVYLLQG